MVNAIFFDGFYFFLASFNVSNILGMEIPLKSVADLFFVGESKQGKEKGEADKGEGF